MVVGSFLQEVVHDRYRGRDGRLCRFSRACRKPESPASRSALTAAATAVLLRKELASMPPVPRSRATMSPFWKKKQETRIVTVPRRGHHPGKISTSTPIRRTRGTTPAAGSQREPAENGGK